MEQEQMKNLKEMIEQYNREILKFRELSLPVMQPQQAPENIVSSQETTTDSTPSPVKNSSVLHQQEIDVITPTSTPDDTQISETTTSHTDSPVLLDDPKMLKGFLLVQTFTGKGAIPVSGADVAVFQITPGGEVLICFLQTDGNGLTNRMELDAPDSNQPSFFSAAACAYYNIFIRHPQFRSVWIHNIPIFSGITSRLPIDLIPSSPFTQTEDCFSTTIPPFPFLKDQKNKPVSRNDGDDLL